MSNSNLIREKRMDKTGKMVTRLVRPVAPVSEPARSLPVQMADSMSRAMKAHRSAQRIAGSLYSVAEDGELLDAYGNGMDEYGFEEAVDALSEMLTLETLTLLEEKLEGVTDRCRQLIAEQVYDDILVYCANEQAGEESSPLGSADLAELRRSIELAETADGFADDDADFTKVLGSLHYAVKSVRRGCKGPEWEALLADPDSRRRFIASEFVTRFVHEGDVFTEEGRPGDIYARRMAIMDNLERVRKHQRSFAERGGIDVGLLDGFDGIDGALRSGAL